MSSIHSRKVSCELPSLFETEQYSVTDKQFTRWYTLTERRQLRYAVHHRFRDPPAREPYLVSSKFIGEV